MDEEEAEMYLEVLRDGTTPFDRFVSTYNVEDPVDVANPRREMDEKILLAVRKTSKDHGSRFIPILGSAGAGKTHAYWAYKELERKLQEQLKEQGLEGRLDTEAKGVAINWTIVYIPSPPAPVRILFHIYTCIINEIPDVIENVSKGIVKKFGGDKKKFGIFGKADIDEVIAKAASEYPGVFADCVKMLVTYGMTGDKKTAAYAKRWLLGEVIEEDELEELMIQSVIEQDDVCLAMIKLISDYLNKVMILYFDEFESPYRTHGRDAEIAFLETLKRIYNEVPNLVIVAAILKDIWPRLNSPEVTDEAFRSRMEQEVELKPFSFGDMKIWFAKSQEHFWVANNMVTPSDMLFPLNETVLKIIFDRTHGNPRETIKLTRVFIDKIVYGGLSLSEITEETKPEEVEAKVGVPQVQTMISMAEKKVEEIIDKEGLIIDVNPASVLGSALKGVQELAKKHLASPDALKVTMAFKFFLGQKEKEIGALLELDDQKVGIDVPSVKSFDRSGGVAAYYSAKRLADGLTNSTITKGIIILPESTKGEKTQYLFEHNPGLIEFKLSQEQAEELIKCALDPDKEFSKENYDLFNIVSGLSIAPPPPPGPQEPEGNAPDS